MGKSKSKVIDLKPETISEEHLKTLQSIVTSINKLQFDIGNLEVQKQKGVSAVIEGNEELMKFRGVLEAEYGVNDINIHTGEISPASNDQPSNS